MAALNVKETTSHTKKLDLAKKSFFFIWLLVCFRVTPSQLLIEFSFVVFECPVLSVLFYPLSISLQSSFFGQYFLVYFLKLYCYFSHVACSFFLLLSVPLFLIIRACFRWGFFFRFQSNFPSRFLLFLRAFGGDPYFFTN